jgi:DNA invertase Pin-like site-specific DNA recombinase
MLTGAPIVATSVGAWFRVSSGGQDEANQVPDVERYCTQRGYRINKRYEVHDKSAYHGEQEAALKEALEDLRTGVIQKLVCWHSDRLDRRGVMDALSFIIDVRKAGGVVESAKEGILDENSLDTIINTWMNHKKSAHLSEQVGIAHDRIRTNRGNGKGLLGRAPFGYEIQGDKYFKYLAPTPLGLKYVPEMFNRIIAGDSLATVAKWLNSENVSTGCTYRKKKTGELTKGWTASTVRQIIRNTVYKGQMRDSNHDVVGTCDAIVTSAVFRQAGERLDKGPKRGPENNANKALLTSHVFCVKCRSPMYKVTTSAKEPYYRCSGKLAANAKPCGVMVRMSVLDAIVDENMSCDPNPVMKLTLIPGKNYDDEIDLVRAQIKTLASDPDADDYEDKHAELMTELKRLKALDTTPDEWREEPTGETNGDKWTSADFAGKREILKEWRVTFKWDEIDGVRYPMAELIHLSYADGIDVSEGK